MVIPEKNAIVWFRQDLRLCDNPALYHATQNGYKILPIYILDDSAANEWKMGGASRWWLHESLSALQKSFSGNLGVFQGNAQEILDACITQHNIQAIFWNRCYEPWRIARDSEIMRTLKEKGITVQTFNGSLLWEPWDIKNNQNNPYKVFTPFFRKGCLNAPTPRDPLPAPEKIITLTPAQTHIDALCLLPSIEWYQDMQKVWTPGENGATEKLKQFLKNGLKNYKTDRNRPDLENVSRLSAHLHFGEISPNTAWHYARHYGLEHHLEADTDTFCSELGWREFSNSLLYYHPDLPQKPLQEKFSHYPWIENPAALHAWQRGKTGIPIVDAGMRQLWQTGWMHNRVRMIVGSFLVKNLRLHWRHGENWFWDTLVDADLANNAASWQWIAGCGADAAPYFRIFNPITQGEKFDPEGTYVRQFVPELKDLPPDYIHKPWEAPPIVLKSARIVLGKNYPHAIVDLQESRKQALEGYAMLKGIST